MSAVLAPIADALFSARAEKRQIPPVRTSFGLGTVAEAYGVQELNTRRWLAEGRRLVGRKIGLTSRAVQAQLGVDQPDFGMLWADMGHVSGEVVPAGAFMQPKVEMEVAFVVGRRLERPDLTRTELVGAIEYALPAVEIVDSAIADWAISIVDTVADNASSGAYVLGTQARRLHDLDLRLCGGVLSRNGTIAAVGTGAACLGDPLEAALWLARRMAELDRPLEEGDVVLSGALGPMVSSFPGDVVVAEIQGFSPVQFAFLGGEARP